MSKIVTFGEIMLRLAPKGYLRFLQEPEFQATFEAVKPMLLYRWQITASTRRL